MLSKTLMILPISPLQLIPRSTLKNLSDKTNKKHNGLRKGALGMKFEKCKE